MKKASNHPNIVAFHGWYRDKSNVLCLVLGYCEGGSLDSLTVQKGATASYFSEVQILEWFVQLLSALGHLHQHHIIHRHVHSTKSCMTRHKPAIDLLLSLAVVTYRPLGTYSTTITFKHFLKPSNFQSMWRFFPCLSQAIYKWAFVRTLLLNLGLQPIQKPFSIVV